MGFVNDLFEHKREGHHNDHGYYGGHRERGDHDHHGGSERYFYLFDRLKTNKKLLVAISVVAIVMFILVVSVIIMFLPLMIKLLGTLQKSGISGLIETLKPLLELLWSGTGK
ncbi:MAG: hypothetical protein PHI06_13595 [Desulfobulbaceae bacterium]|nr:hypothetical protein [Desulfobulbaceae bacterium]